MTGPKNINRPIRPVLNPALGGVLIGICGLAACTQNTPESESIDNGSTDNSHEYHAADVDIQDSYLKAWYELTEERVPPAQVPGVDYGMDENGSFVHPAATPSAHEPKVFPGQLDYWETESYSENMEVLAFYPEIVSPWHVWQSIVDLGDRRIMYVHDEGDIGIYDITDPTDMKSLFRQGTEWKADTQFHWSYDAPPEKEIGAAAIQWNAELDSYIMVQSFEAPRFTLVTEDKRRQPQEVSQSRNFNRLKGFRVYKMNGPLIEDWELLAEVSTDHENSDAPIGQQRGSGSIDVPAWFGGKYMFLAAAPDASYALTEYPTFLWSAGQQAWDMSDPSNPVFLDQWTAPGQIVGDSAHEAAYLENPRAGNRTSWMGARMPLFIPKAAEDGGQYGYAAMGGLGMFIVDISDPEDMKTVSHVEFPPSVSGTEADSINVSQVESTGIVYVNGYPLAEDCYEPYKDIFIVDVNDPTKPEILGTMPRPLPPAEAPYTDFCQRRGSFGPKRFGYHTQPGRWREDLIPYAFYNAGVQLFDVSNPREPEIVAYFVPPYAPDAIPDYAQGNSTFGIYVEYDRNIIWAMTSHGMYALSSPLLGEPLLSQPESPWPPQN